MDQKSSTEINKLRCTVCKNGETKSGKSVVTLTKGEFVMVIRNVPAKICRDCGEEYVNDEITRIILAAANESFKKGVALEVVDYIKIQ